MSNLRVITGGASKPSSASSTAPPDDPPPNGERRAVTAECSDLRNAERLLEMYGQGLRYVEEWEKWLAWTGKVWLVGPRYPHLYARKVARILLAEAKIRLEASKSSDNELEKVGAKNFYTWARESQSSARINAMIGMAYSDEQLTCHAKQLNTHPMLLTVQNGTINLKTGSLQPFHPHDYITKLAPVTFDADATCPTWERFVSQAMGGDKESVRYLQRFIGYSLTGSTKEQCLAFFYGDGRNGKSTFLNTIYTMLGPYAAKAPRKFLMRAESERHPTELIPLFGARFVMCHEVGSTDKIDEGLLKDVTGSDPLSARRMREDNWEFVPTHTLFAYGNSKPSIRGQDEGIWRRVRLIPWSVQIAEKSADKSLPTKLERELPGILNWALKGCLEWQKSGLGEAAAVKQATQEYRKESDPFADFFTNRCTFSPGATISRQSFRAAYERHCEELGETHPMGYKALAGALQRKGVKGTSVREGGKVRDGWRGVALRAR